MWRGRLRWAGLIAGYESRVRSRPACCGASAVVSQFGLVAVRYVGWLSRNLWPGKGAGCPDRQAKSPESLAAHGEPPASVRYDIEGFAAMTGPVFAVRCHVFGACYRASGASRAQWNFERNLGAGPRNPDHQLD